MEKEVNLLAYPRSFKDILSLQKKYIIPRYQREYSWEKEQLSVFWEDILEQINYENGKFFTKDYFLGSLVLVGDESATEFLVVDGQQRLTTITILLSALAEIGAKLGKDLNNQDYQNFSKSCYEYIEGRDGDYREFFKLINETPKPFFQNAIQHIDKKDIKPESEEEKRLLDAYKFFIKNINIDEIKSLQDLEVKPNILDFLKAVRDQVIQCRTIFITVDNEKDAQTIFETLNAKGKDLETIDLIKNNIFEVLSKEHPSDLAKDSWNKVKKLIAAREDKISLAVFFRHFWIAKYAFVTENKIYKSFQEKVSDKKGDVEEIYTKFLNDLVNCAEIYSKIVSPLEVDWKLQEEKKVLGALKALKIFRVSQARPLIMTAIGLYNRRIINITDLSDLLVKLEWFHFVFSAITSSRASGLESLFSKYSRQLNDINCRNRARGLFEEIAGQLGKKLEEVPKATFEEKFCNLQFSNSFTKDKKLIQYVFDKLERIYRGTDEVAIDVVTLEHIYSQQKNGDWSHKIGNILPLARGLNEDCKDYDLGKKMAIFSKSELKQVQDFYLKHQGSTEWNEDLTNSRGRVLAEQLYNHALSYFNYDKQA